MLIQNDSKVKKKNTAVYILHHIFVTFPTDRILVFNICLISISDTVFDGVAKTLVLNMERPSKKFEPDVFE